MRSSSISPAMPPEEPASKDKRKALLDRSRKLGARFSKGASRLTERTLIRAAAESPQGGTAPGAPCAVLPCKQLLPRGERRSRCAGQRRSGRRDNEVRHFPSRLCGCHDGADGRCGAAACRTRASAMKSSRSSRQCGRRCQVAGATRSAVANLNNRTDEPDRSSRGSCRSSIRRTTTEAADRGAGTPAFAREQLLALEQAIFAVPAIPIPAAASCRSPARRNAGPVQRCLRGLFARQRNLRHRPDRGAGR